MRILSLIALLALISDTALASDYTGLGSIFIGFPIAIIAIFINLLIKISGSVSSFSFGVSGFATAATVLASLLVSDDAISMFQNNDGLDKMAAVSLFILTGLSVYIFTGILKAKESMERDRGDKK